MTVQNIYPQLISTLSPRVRAYVDWLDQNGQVDRDDDADPIVTRVDPIQPNNVRVFLLRNGYEENFIMNPRKRAGPDGVVEPIRMTWNFGDGYHRPDPDRKRLDQPEPRPGAERAMRDYRGMVRELIADPRRPGGRA